MSPKFKSKSVFSVQSRVRKPWRRYIDSLAPLRNDLHRYCCKLTGNVWDGEDLVQDTLIRVFGLLGKIDAQLENPRAYLIRTATNLWIDRCRRSAREHAILELEGVADLETNHQEEGVEKLVTHAELKHATHELMQTLYPQERAALVLKDVYDLSLQETAKMLKTTVGAVKSALQRSRKRIGKSKTSANFSQPHRALVESFLQALSNQDLETLQSICATDLQVELVGGAESDTFEQGKNFFKHAHMVMPALGFGKNPHWQLEDYDGEPIIVGYRTLNGSEGVNEIHRIEAMDNLIIRVRCYCFCPDTLKVVAEQLGTTALQRPLTHRSPSLSDIPGLLLSHFWGLRNSG